MGREAAFKALMFSVLCFAAVIFDKFIKLLNGHARKATGILDGISQFPGGSQQLVTRFAVGCTSNGNNGGVNEASSGFT
jgi:hypothetical protein